MNMFKAFEERIAKAFGESSLGIVAPLSFKRLARHAVRELERETYVVDGVNTAPALMTVLVSPDDDAIMRPVYAQLAQEIADLMESEAAHKEYVFVGKPLARFMADSSLRHGRFATFANNVDALTLEKLRDEERAFLSGFSAFAEVGAMVPVEEQEAPQPAINIPEVEHALDDDSAVGLDVFPVGYADDPFDLGHAATPNPMLDLPQASMDSLEDSLPEMDEVSEIMEIPQPIETGEPADAVAAAEPSVPAHAAAAHAAAEPETAAEIEQDEMKVPSHMLTEELDANDGAETESAPEDEEEPATCLLIDRQSGRTYIGTAPETIVGRERTPGGIVLRDPNVSRRHSRLTYKNGVWRIVDLDSTNGTLVNDIDVDTCVLRNGDVLTLGLTNLEFRES